MKEQKQASNQRIQEQQDRKNTARVKGNPAEANKEKKLKGENFPAT
jgi:hypothetical protein